MEAIKSYLIDFVEGRVSVPEFIVHCDKHPEVYDYLTQIAMEVDPNRRLLVIRKFTDEKGTKQFVPDYVPYSAKRFAHNYLSGETPCSGKLGAYLNIHSSFSDFIIAAFPEEQIKKDQTLDSKFVFKITACPSYIGGTEVDHLIEEQLELLPEGVSKAERTKLFKERMKEIFHIEGRKFPYWVQSPDWPMGSNGKPMRFVKQIRAKGKLASVSFTTYYFEDIETGEQRIVEQFT